MKYIASLLVVSVFVITGCTVQQSNDRIDQATFRTKQAVDSAGKAAKAGAEVSINATNSAVDGVSGAVDSVKETSAPLLNNAKEGIEGAVESVKEVVE